MREEEIIDRINEVINLYKSNMQGYSYQALQGLLDLYNKQKEEIKAMTLNYEALASICSPMLQKIKDDYIHKDKIRDKIKELEEKEKNCNFTGLITECEIKIETLKELLEEK